MKLKPQVKKIKNYLLSASLIPLVLVVACGTAAAPTSVPSTPASTTPTDATDTPSDGQNPQATPTSNPQPTTLPDSSISGRNDVTIVLAAEPPGLDMFLTSGSEHSTIYRENLTDKITWVDKETKELVPLSGFSGWESVAPERWRFFLREGVKFHNGEEWNAAAAKVSVDIQGDPNRGTDSFNDTGHIVGEVVDNLTLDIVCDSACPIFPGVAKALGFQAPKWYTENPEEVTIRNTMGFGPYRLVSWDPGLSIQLEAHPDYLPNPESAESRAPVLQNVTYLFREESAVRSAMVQAGEADLANNISLDDQDRVPVFQTTASGLQLILVIDNIWHPQLSKKEVRQALAYGIDCQAIVDTILGGSTTCRGIPAFPGVLGATEANLAPYQYDPERAKQLLDEAGYDGEEIRISGRTVAYTGQQEVMEAIASYWTELGLNVNLEFLESGVHRTIRNCGIGNVDGDVTREPSECDHSDIYDTGVDLASFDYSRLFYGWLSCTAPTSRVCEPNMEQLGQRAIAATGEERRQLLEQMANITREDVLFLSLFDGVIFIGQAEQLEWEARGFDRIVRVNMMNWK
jgi:peptide/nickel transport system substrate-binding protein